MRFNEQTIIDCNLLPSRENKSIFELFDYTFTSGGSAALEEMLLEKKESVNDIVEMQAAIRFMSVNPQCFVPLNNADIEYMRQYFRLNLQSASTQRGSLFLRLGFSGKDTYQLLRGNVLRLTQFLRMVAQKCARVKLAACPAIIADQFAFIQQALDDNFVKSLLELNIEVVSSKKILESDHFFRNHFRLSFNLLLDALFTLEAIWSVSYASTKHKLNFPVVSDAAALSVKGCYHPLLKDPVRNDVTVSAAHNTMFLSGANMAGKSTYLRSIGTIVCLAHAGFPVPAASASIPFYNEIYVCITTNDSQLKGYSHFYNEILQIKRLMVALEEAKNCFAIFDEVLNGTNVKDAQACCTILLKKLKAYPRSLVLLSSHNLELPEEALHDHVIYSHLEVLLNGEKPVFTYRLKDGKNQVSLGLKLFQQLGLGDVNK